MASRTAVLLLAFLLCCSAASAFNITKLLGQYPDFSTFNSYLSQTQVADEINRRQTITVLAVDNSAVSAVSGQPDDVIKKVLSVHVVLDYYDVEKLQQLQKKTTLLTTLFQASGLALGQAGFLNVTVSPAGVAFGSAVSGSGLNVRLVKAVTAQPYNISVLQVSGVIIPTGIQNANQTSTPPPAPIPAATPKTAPTPAATPKAAPTPKGAPVPAAPTPKKAHAPTPSKNATPPAPATLTPAESPDDATPAPSVDGPTADSPVASAPAGDSPGPAADDVPSDQGEAPAPSTPSRATRVVSGAGVAAVVGAAMLVAF